MRGDVFPCWRSITDLLNYLERISLSTWSWLLYTDSDSKPETMGAVHRPTRRCSCSPTTAHGKRTRMICAPVSSSLDKCSGGGEKTGSNGVHQCARTLPHPRLQQNKSVKVRPSARTVRQAYTTRSLRSPSYRLSRRAVPRPVPPPLHLPSPSRRATCDA
ncbi:hypothetical protein B0H14DRAFT_2700495 [Mycena olivaceomarginata]|nr:hypothetical protein B0H14DRAFT_2700495 [Mycena olivaceomarginata]